MVDLVSFSVAFSELSSSFSLSSSSDPVPSFLAPFVSLPSLFYVLPIMMKPKPNLLQVDVNGRMDLVSVTSCLSSLILNGISQYLLRSVFLLLSVSSLGLEVSFSKSSRTHLWPRTHTILILSLFVFFIRINYSSLVVIKLSV